MRNRLTIWLARRAYAWAGHALARPPDFIIGGGYDPYLRRWYLIPRNRWFNLYLHRVDRSDDDRALHDHPWANISLILSGGYLEVVPDDQVRARLPGEIVCRRATALHRLVMPIDAQVSYSLFITGPKIRNWGFQCPQGWVPWQQFTDPADPGGIGRGCGE